MATGLNTNRPIRWPTSKYPLALADQWLTYTGEQVPKKENSIGSHISSTSLLTPAPRQPHHCFLADSLSLDVLPATALWYVQ